MKDIQAISFDADGTLLTFASSIGEQYSRIFKRFDILLPALDIERAVWHSWQELQSLYLNEADGFRTSPEQEQSFWQSFFSSVCDTLKCNYTDELFLAVYDHFATIEARPLKSGVVSLVNELKERGFLVFVLSNHDSRLQKVLSESEIAGSLDAVFTADVVGFKKPAKEAFAFATVAFDLAPQHILHIGNDLRCDYQGAKAAGLDALLLDEGRKYAASPECNSVPSVAAVSEYLLTENP